jgi:16S rRNA methyltransferase RsmF-like protein
VKPGGRLAYVTCSLLVEENEAQAERFLAETPDFTLIPIARAWLEAIGTPCRTTSDTLRLTPTQHGTDGFFVALFERAPSPHPDPPPRAGEGDDDRQRPDAPPPPQAGEGWGGGEATPTDQPDDPT